MQGCRRVLANLHWRFAGLPSLAEGRPDLVAQIYLEKYPGFDPNRVTLGSPARVVWLCKCRACGAPHKWSARVKDRAREGKGCPFCTNRQPCQCNSLKAVFPDVAAEWHASKNGQISPKDVLPNSKRKVWWMCRVHSSHPPWQAAVAARVHPKHPSSCPVCGSAARVRSHSKRGSLVQERPDLAGQWHPIRNSSLTAHDITCGSSRLVWWHCPKSNCQHPHEWQARVHHRDALDSGCPFCSNRQVCPCRSLAATHPDVAAQWHPTKNDSLMPEQVSSKSNKRVWWQQMRPDGDMHEWAVRVSDRVRRQI